MTTLSGRGEAEPVKAYGLSSPTQHSAVGWLCPRCGNSNSPQLLVCGCSSGTAADPFAVPQQATASTANGTASTAASPVAHKGSKSLEPRTSTTKNRYQYNDPDFQQFWEVYPLKRGKAAAYRKFVAAVAAGVEPHRIITAATAYRNSSKRDPEFTKWPEGWLAAGRWDDEYNVDRPTIVGTDPAHIVGTPEWMARVEAEEDAAIKAAGV